MPQFFGAAPAPKPTPEQAVPTGTFLSGGSSPTAPTQPGMLLPGASAPQGPTALQSLVAQIVAHQEANLAFSNQQAQQADAARQAFMAQQQRPPMPSFQPGPDPTAMYRQYMMETIQAQAAPMPRQQMADPFRQRMRSRMFAPAMADMRPSFPIKRGGYDDDMEGTMYPSPSPTPLGGGGY